MSLSSPPALDAFLGHQACILHRINAPESGQFCRKDGKRFRCGQQAALALAKMVGRSTILCEPRDVDRYGRIVDIFQLGTADFNRWMVWMA